MRTTAARAGRMLLVIAAAPSVLPLPAFAAVKVAPPATSPAAAAQAEAPAGSPTESAKALGKIVGRLAQKNSLSAPDVSEFAHETIRWGRRVRDAHAPVPPGPVYDALAGLDQLEARGEKLTDGEQVRKDLEELLQRPSEQQQQQQQNQQKNQQQNQSQPQQQKDQNKDQQQSQQQQQNQPSPDQSQKDQPQQQQPSPQNPSTPPSQPKSDQSAFGDMSKPPPPPPPQGETQKVGGAPEKNQPQDQTDPSMTLPMEKLDQLKNQDSPAQLFQMMQSDRSQASRKKPEKDW